jgi:hypothetical protein
VHQAGAWDIDACTHCGAGSSALTVNSPVARPSSTTARNTESCRRHAEQILVRTTRTALATLVVRTGMDADQRTGQVVERLAQALLYTTDDKQEGTAAILQSGLPPSGGA